MPSKEKAHHNNESLLSHQIVRPQSQSADAHDQPIVPVKAAQKVRLTPQLLTTHDVLQLQRTIGNRACSRLIAQVVQRKPVEVEKGVIYTDDTYSDVRLEKVDSNAYKILNEGNYKDITIYYDRDQGKYYVAEDLGKFGYGQTEEVFDLGVVSSINIVETKVLTKYDKIGVEGKGIGYVEEDTLLETSGILTCVGWLLYNDDAAYMTHIVVLKPDKVVADGSINEQVGKLYDLFNIMIGSKPTHLVIHVDEEQSMYDEKYGIWKSSWMQELVLSSCNTSWQKGSDLRYIIHPSKGKRKEWNGPAIKVKYLE